MCKSFTSLFFTSLLFAWCSDSLAQNTQLDIPEDAKMSYIELSKKYLKKGEEYDLMVEDGYILKLFRIPGDENKPTLLAHGALDSADSFIIRGNTSLAAILSKENFDVWAINFRGNRYSRRHVTMNPDLDKKFWDFCAHEYGYYDLPAAIDFILNITKQKTLSVIGYSQGTTAGYIMGATRPEYNSKISVLISMAPVGYLHNVREYTTVIMYIAPFLDAFGMELDIEEIAGDNTTIRNLLNTLCLTKSGYKTCLLNGLFLLTGSNPSETESEFYPIIISHSPAGTSRRSLIHYAQISLRRKFANYDYGFKGNMLKYNSSTPPEYDLSKVTMKVALIVGKNDRMATIKDVELLRKKLPNVVDYKLMQSNAFSHVDFIWGRSNYKTLYPHILHLLNKYQ